MPKKIVISEHNVTDHGLIYNPAQKTLTLFTVGYNRNTSLST